MERMTALEFKEVVEDILKVRRVGISLLPLILFLLVLSLIVYLVMS